MDKILAELGEWPTISKQADPPLSSQEAEVENPPNLVTPPNASVEKKAEEESTETTVARKKKKRRQKEREKEKLLKNKQEGKLLTGDQSEVWSFFVSVSELLRNKVALREAVKISTMKLVSC